MKKRSIFVFFDVMVCLALCTLMIDRSSVYAVSAPSVIYCGKGIVDLYIGDCGEGKRCELYRDGSKIASQENLLLGGFYFSDKVSSNTKYGYKVVQYTYNAQTESWDGPLESSEKEVDTFYVSGTIHNGQEWLAKLDRLPIMWSSAGNPHYCKGITVEDGDLYIAPKTEIVFCTRTSGLYDLKGKLDAEEVTFTRWDDAVSPEVIASGGTLKDCVFPEYVKLSIEGEGGHYAGNEFDNHHLWIKGQNHLFENNSAVNYTFVYLSYASGCTVDKNAVHHIQVGGSANIIRNNTCTSVYVDWGDANEVRGNRLLDGGVLLDEDVTNTLIQENTMICEEGIGGHGVRLQGRGNTVRDNVIRDRSVGIYSQGSGTYGNVIENNRIMDCSQYGIQIKFGPYENVIQKNYIARSGYCGIYMLGASANQIVNNAFDSNGGNCGDKYWLGNGGIQLSDSSGNYLYNDEAGSIQNIIAYNYIWGSITGTGIAVLNEYCKGTGIHDNSIEDNALGVNLEGSGGSVYNNIFRRNVQHARGAATPEGGIDNRWNHERVAVNQNILGGPYLGGNYWSDYTGADADSDEIGDTPYTIYDKDGNAVAEDDLPLKPGSHYADIAVNPSSCRFGAVELGYSSDPTTVLVSNEGTAGLTVNPSITGANAAEFAIVEDPCSGSTLASSGSCLLAVVFTPVTEGQKEATLRLSSNDLDESPLNILLYGGGVTPQPGDLNLDWKIDLADALIALQVMVSRHPELSLKGDVSNDDRINMVDVLYIIQVLADLREE